MQRESRVHMIPTDGYTPSLSPRKLIGPHDFLFTCNLAHTHSLVQHRERCLISRLRRGKVPLYPIIIRKIYILRYETRVPSCELCAFCLWIRRNIVLPLFSFFNLLTSRYRKCCFLTRDVIGICMTLFKRFIIADDAYNLYITDNTVW